MVVFHILKLYASVCVTLQLKRDTFVSYFIKETSLSVPLKIEPISIKLIRNEQIDMPERLSFIEFFPQAAA